MKESTKRLLDRLEDAHDWTDGQVWGHGGTAYSSTDTCRACGLQRHWHSDTQNGVDSTYNFSNGDDLSLHQAIVRGCN